MKFQSGFSSGRNSVLHLAVIRPFQNAMDHHGVVKTLLAAGADPFLENRQRALHLSLQRPRSTCVSHRATGASALTVLQIACRSNQCRPLHAAGPTRSHPAHHAFGSVSLLAEPEHMHAAARVVNSTEGATLDGRTVRSSPLLGRSEHSGTPRDSAFTYVPCCSFRNIRQDRGVCPLGYAGHRAQRSGAKRCGRHSAAPSLSSQGTLRLAWRTWC